MSEIKTTPGAAYLHFTTNETIAGRNGKRSQSPKRARGGHVVRHFIAARQRERLWIDLRRRPKKHGPSEWSSSLSERFGTARAGNSAKMFRYSTHIENDSMLNTPPCFSIYVLMLVTRWVQNWAGSGHGKNQPR